MLPTFARRCRSGKPLRLRGSTADAPWGRVGHSACWLLIQKCVRRRASWFFVGGRCDSWFGRIVSLSSAIATEGGTGSEVGVTAWAQHDHASSLRLQFATICGTSRYSVTGPVNSCWLGRQRASRAGLELRRGPSSEHGPDAFAFAGRGSDDR